MYKVVNLKGVRGTVKVSEDGKEIFYNDKLVRQSLLKSKAHTKGYLSCSIEGKQFYAHHIVAEAFVPNKHPITNKLVLHVDCDTINNYYKNLVWGNPKLLFKHRVEQNVAGAGPINSTPTYRGGSSISYDEALKIAKRLDAGETARAICKEYNVSEMSIIRIRKRYCQKKVASPRYSQDIKNVVYQLNEKHSYKKIATITGIRYETVLKWCKSRNKVAEKVN
jgi:hypothetical protein